MQEAKRHDEEMQEAKRYDEEFHSSGTQDIPKSQLFLEDTARHANPTQNLELPAKAMSDSRGCLSGLWSEWI